MHLLAKRNPSQGRILQNGRGNYKIHDAVPQIIHALPPVLLQYVRFQQHVVLMEAEPSADRIHVFQRKMCRLHGVHQLLLLLVREFVRGRLEKVWQTQTHILQRGDSNLDREVSFLYAK